jgi:hypothetical protein
MAILDDCSLLGGVHMEITSFFNICVGNNLDIEEEGSFSYRLWLEKILHKYHVIVR